jgi:hypothetical protein
VPDWLAECRAAGLLVVRVVHGKGTGQLRAGVSALLDRSPLVRARRSDGNWGGTIVELWDPATDEARVRAIVEESPRLLAALDAVARVGPPGAWVGAGALRNRVWHRFHGHAGEPDDTDVDVAWHGPGDVTVDARYTTMLGDTFAAPWEVTDQARFGAGSAEAGIASWPETATAVATRLEMGSVALFAAYGWADLLGMVVRPRPGLAPETWRARVATKRWRSRFAWVRVERG